MSTGGRGGHNRKTVRIAQHPPFEAEPDAALPARLLSSATLFFCPRPVTALNFHPAERIARFRVIAFSRPALLLLKKLFQSRFGGASAGPARGAAGASGGPDGRQAAAAFGLAVLLYFSQLNRATGEDHADFRYETYNEGNGRIGVETETGLFEFAATPWLSLKGEVVYDAISGATPTGAPPPSKLNFAVPTGPLSDSVPTAFMRDYRTAGSLDAGFSFGPDHITPQFSYSEEHDYISYGGAVNYSLDLNQKNTALNLGWSHDSDTVLPYPGTYIFQAQGKESDQFLAGVNQLLDSKTTLTVNFTFSDAHGYLSDPYRGVVFDDYPQYDPANISLFAENRPRHRQSYTGYASLTRFVTPLRGSAELSYRFYDDTYGIRAHTVEAAWHQKLGPRVTLSPLFRYYCQTAANFYGTQFAGDPTDPSDPAPIPSYYSADFRLSEMETFTYGLSLTAKITDWLSLDLGYKRYAMYGLDGVTSPGAYPKANIITLGARAWF
jgi:hypothetical protein